MATYAIGDIQGCYDQLRILLDELNFDSQYDQLWLVGDLVNRGPQSLEVLRFIKSLGPQATAVLGNHDMHLLALSQGNTAHYKNNSLDAILAAPDKDELIDWLRHRPFLYHSDEKKFTMVHAGLPPQWNLSSALQYAKEVENVLQGDGMVELIKNLYGNEPNRWSNELTGIERYRFIINCFTRLRYCFSDGTLALREKSSPGTQSPELIPWFEIPQRASASERIVCGHWSTLGLNICNNVWSLDTGCLWGGKLTALRVRKYKPMFVLQIDCPNIANPLDYIKPAK